MNKQLTLSDLVINTEKFSTSQNYNRVDVFYKPKSEKIGQLTVDNEGEIVVFDEEGDNIQHKPVKDVSEACHFLLNRKYSR